MGQRYGLFVGPNGLANNKGAFLCPYLPLHCVHHQHTGIILDAIAEEVHDVGPKAFRILIRYIQKDCTPTFPLFTLWFLKKCVTGISSMLNFSNPLHLSRNFLSKRGQFMER